MRTLGMCALWFLGIGAIVLIHPALIFVILLLVAIANQQTRNP